MEYILGIDVGGTSFKYGVLDKRGNIAYSGKKKRLKDYSDKKLLADLINETKTNYNLIGVGISLPGNPDDKTGYMETGGAIDEFFNFHIGAYIKENCNLDIAIENDCHCALLAEKWLGNAQSCENFMVITFGTGIGGAAFINGKLHNGQRNLGSEVHSLIIELTDNLEPIFWGDVNSTVNGLIIPAAKYLNVDPETVDGAKLYQATDPNIIEIIRVFHRKVALGLITINNLFDVEKILIGGGISENPEFISAINAEIDKIKNTFAMIHVDRCTLGNNAGFLGACYKFMLKKGLVNNETIGNLDLS